jgi:predicted XRE-type DNA-binding protein
MVCSGGEFQIILPTRPRSPPKAVTSGGRGTDWRRPNCPVSNPVTGAFCISLENPFPVAVYFISVQIIALERQRMTQTVNSHANEIILYQPDNAVKLEVRLENETVWLTQAQIADLFGVQIPAISKHLRNIFNSNELRENSVISILETTATDGKKYQTKFYNLDAILSVGYRVNSINAR